MAKTENKSVERLLALQAKEWTRNEEASRPEKFDSMFTNIYGEQWWCLCLEQRLVVWGDDVAGTAVSAAGADVQTVPWIMNSAESLWLQANIEVARERYAHATTK